MNKVWFWAFLIGVAVGVALYRRQTEAEPEVVVVPT